MSEMDEAKIATAVEKCVACASAAEAPLGKVADFLLILCCSDWSAAELIEVRSRVLKRVGKRFLDARLNCPVSLHIPMPPVS
jgi:hypothetical protein